MGNASGSDGGGVGSDSTSGLSGRSGSRGAEAGNNQRGGFSGGSTGTPGSFGGGPGGNIADTGRNQSNSFGGRDTISGNRPDFSNPTGYGTFGARPAASVATRGLTPVSGYTAAPARQSLPAAVPALPAAVPAVVAPPVSLTPAVTTSTVPSTPPSVPIGPSGMPSLDALAAQITGQSLASIQGNTAPVAAAPSMAMSSASPASRSPAGYAAAARAVGARASTPSMGMSSASPASRNPTGYADAARTVGEMAAGVPSVNRSAKGNFGDPASGRGLVGETIGNISRGIADLALGRPTTSQTKSQDRLGQVLGVSRTRDTSPGVSAYGAASRSVADLTGFTGNSVLGQGRSNVIGGFQDPSTNAVGFSAARGLSSRIGAANSAINSSFGGQLIGGVMSGMQSMGLPAPVGLPGTQADIARSQFAAENPLSSRPVAEVTVTGDLAQRPAQEDVTPVSEATLEAARQIALEAREERARNASMQMAEEPMGPPSISRNPYGTPSSRPANAQQRAYGSVDTAAIAQQQQAANNASARSNYGAAALNQGLASPFGDPSTGVQFQAARGMLGLNENVTDQQIAQGLLNAQNRAAQKQERTNQIGGALRSMQDAAAGQRRSQQQQSTNAIQQGLLGLEAQRSMPTVEPASLPDAEPMPGGAETVDTGFSIVRALRDGFRDATGETQETDDQGEVRQFDGEFSADDFVDFAENPNVAPNIRERYANRRAPVTIRNNNMGALSIVGNTNRSWVARLPGFIGTTPRPRSEGGSYARFATPEHGVYAASELLRRYGARGRNTVDAIVNRWAVDNNDNYKNHVVQSLRNAGFEVDVDTALDLEDPEVREAVLKGKSGFESGTLQPVYTDETFAAGVRGQFNNALMAGQIGGDLSDDDIGGFLDAALSDDEAQAFLAQQGYSEGQDMSGFKDATDIATELMSGNYSDAFSRSVEKFGLMNTLRALNMFTRGSVPPPSGRPDTDRGGGDIYIPPQTNGRRSRNSGGSRAPTPPAPTYPGTPDWWQNWRQNYGQYGLLGPRPVAAII